jgi:hypothetical protein
MTPARGVYSGGTMVSGPIDCHLYLCIGGEASPTPRYFWVLYQQPPMRRVP